MRRSMRAISKGYRPGGPNALSPLRARRGAAPRFQSDSIIDYEAGIKGDFFAEHRAFVRADRLLHRLERHPKLLVRVGNFGVNSNGGGAESKGLEGTFHPRARRGPDADGQRGLHRRQPDVRHRGPAGRPQRRPPALLLACQRLAEARSTPPRRSGTTCACSSAEAVRFTRPPAVRLQRDLRTDLAGRATPLRRLPHWHRPGASTGPRPT